jgi:hypothetical protein
VGRAVVLDDHWMVDGDIGGALLEVLGDRVTAFVHDLRHERVSVADGLRRSTCS